MRPEHHRAWLQQAQLDAGRGVIGCRTRALEAELAAAEG